MGNVTEVRTVEKTGFYKKTVVGGKMVELRSDDPSDHWWERRDCNQGYDTCPAVGGSTGIVCRALFAQNFFDYISTVYCGKRPGSTPG